MNATVSFLWSSVFTKRSPIKTFRIHHQHNENRLVNDWEYVGNWAKQIIVSFYLRLKIIIHQFLALILIASTSSKWERNQSLSVTAASSIATGVKKRVLVRTIATAICALYSSSVRLLIPFCLLNKWESRIIFLCIYLILGERKARVLVLQQCHQLLPVLLCMLTGWGCHPCSCAITPFQCCQFFSPHLTGLHFLAKCIYVIISCFEKLVLAYKSASVFEKNSVYEQIRVLVNLLSLFLKSLSKLP